jgi:hypothetical protein
MDMSLPTVSESEGQAETSPPISWAASSYGDFVWLSILQRSMVDFVHRRSAAPHRSARTGLAEASKPTR